MAEEHDDEVHAPGPHDDEHDAHNPKAVLDPKSADKLNKGHKEEIILAVIGILIAVYFFFRSSSSGSSSSTTPSPVGTAQPVTTGGSGSGSGSSGNTSGPLAAEIAKLMHLQTQQANALRTANHNASAAQATTNSEIAKLTAELNAEIAKLGQPTPASGSGTGTTGASSKEGYVAPTITSGGYVSQNMNPAAQDTGAAAGVTVGQAETQAAATNAANAATAQAAYTQQQQQHPGQYYYMGQYYPIGG